jgi:hypothetical protein
VAVAVRTRLHEIRDDLSGWQRTAVAADQPVPKLTDRQQQSQWASSMPALLLNSRWHSATFVMGPSDPFTSRQT